MLERDHNPFRQNGLVNRKIGQIKREQYSFFPYHRFTPENSTSLDNIKPPSFTTPGLKPVLTYKRTSLLPLVFPLRFLWVHAKASPWCTLPNSPDAHRYKE